MADQEAAITPDTRISLAGLRLVLSLIGMVLVIGGAASWRIGSDMVTATEGNVEATEKNREAISGLDKTMAVLATELGALRRDREGDGVALRSHIDSLDAHRGILKPMEARIGALEKADGDRASNLRDIDARVRALENERK